MTDLESGITGMNEKLTPERIEAALHERYTEHMLLELGGYRKDMRLVETAIAALEFVEQHRWRDPAEADKDSKAIVIGILNDGTEGRENTFECVVAKRQDEYLAWTPLPRWEGKE